MFLWRTGEKYPIIITYSLTIPLYGDDNLCYFCSKIYLLGTHWNCLIEAIPVSIQTICFDTKLNKTKLSSERFLYFHMSVKCNSAVGERMQTGIIGTV